MNPIIRDIKEVLLSTGFKHTYILEVSTSQDVIKVKLLLPYHCDSEELETITQNLKEELNANDVKITERKGKQITLLFGMRNLNNVPFSETYIRMNTLKITLPSAFGQTSLDFSDGASCHLLNGGTTRMGKTTFLLYMCTMLYIQQRGDIQLHITSTKIKDYYPFQHIPNVTLTDNEIDFMTNLNECIFEYKVRNRLLQSKSLEKAKDAKDVYEYYPHMKGLFKPIFIIIDEYARFSDNKDIQKMIMELVESAGYVNIHIIISTQRPDARTVLNPRIKSNLLARICFTTADKNNSLIILDQEGAEKLGKIKGRAIFLDSESNLIQVPNISYHQVEQLLKPFKKEIDTHEYENNESEERPTDNQLTSKIQSMFEESNSSLNIQEQYEPDQRSESSTKEISTGWNDIENNARKRPNILLHSNEIKIKYTTSTKNR